MYTDCSFLQVFEVLYHLSLTDSSPLKITSGLDKGLSDRAGVCYLDWKKGLGVIPLALDTEVKN